METIPRESLPAALLALESEHRRALVFDDKLEDCGSESSATGTPTFLLTLHQWGCSKRSPRDQQRQVIGLFAGRVLLHSRHHGLQQGACRQLRVRPQSRDQTLLSEFFSLWVGGFEHAVRAYG